MKTILLVDDDELFRWALRDALEEAGYAISEAKDCAEARANLTSGPDVALLDHRLPDGSGLCLLESLRESNPACLAVVLTAHPTPEGEETARLNGAMYAEKPEAPETVVDIVRSALTERAPPLA